MPGVLEQLVDRHRDDIAHLVRERTQAAPRGGLLDSPSDRARRIAGYTVTLIAAAQLLGEEFGALQTRDLMHRYADRLPIDLLGSVGAPPEDLAEVVRQADPQLATVLEQATA